MTRNFININQAFENGHCCNEFIIHLISKNIICFGLNLSIKSLMQERYQILKINAHIIESLQTTREDITSIHNRDLSAINNVTIKLLSFFHNLLISFIQFRRILNSIRDQCSFMSPPLIGRTVSRERSCSSSKNMSYFLKRNAFNEERKLHRFQSCRKSFASNAVFKILNLFIFAHIS